MIKRIIQNSIDVKSIILNDENLISTIGIVVDIITKTFDSKGKVFFCGNGGSASDAQHLAAELSGRFYFDRDPLFAEALNVNTSYLTAVSNDYGYEHIFSRIIKAKGSKGDILVGLSTSGNSENIVKAFKQAKSQGVITIGLTGQSGGKLKNISDYLITVPSNDTPRIQESHILIGHIICEMVEKNLFEKS